VGTSPAHDGCSMARSKFKLQDPSGCEWVRAVVVGELGQPGKLPLQSAIWREVSRYLSATDYDTAGAIAVTAFAILQLAGASFGRNPVPSELPMSLTSGFGATEIRGSTCSTARRPMAYGALTEWRPSAANPSAADAGCREPGTPAATSRSRG
jgi:hypothetical protein